jgi:hypothetical protein
MSIETAVIALLCAVPLTLLVIDVARGGSSRRRGPRSDRMSQTPPADVPPTAPPAAAARPAPPRRSEAPAPGREPDAPQPPVSPYVLLPAR